MLCGINISIKTLRILQHREKGLDNRMFYANSEEMAVFFLFWKISQGNVSNVLLLYSFLLFI